MTDSFEQHPPPLMGKPKSAAKTRAATDYFEHQIKGIKGAVDQKDLYEYAETLQGEEIISVRAFRKYGYGGIGTFHTYVTQFPFRGHDQLIIQDCPPDKQSTINSLVTPAIDSELLHEDLTADIMKQNPFVFGLYQAKMNEIKPSMKMERNFDLFNRRTEFPYDIIDNPMRIDPH